jgi:hypothetical protein
MLQKPYNIDLTDDEAETIDFVGYRYEWSSALQNLLSFDEDGNVLPVRLTESEAWNLRDAFELDTEGGHSFFPMLDPSSELARKLHAFMERIV